MGRAGPRDFHARAFNPGRWQIITADGADADMLDIEYAEVNLSRIEICPRSSRPYQ